MQGFAGLNPETDRLLARHPNASAQLLLHLSCSSDRATRRAVTLHPNIPRDSLLKLAKQFPGEFFKNPAFDWLLMEHPDLLFDIGGGVLKNLLKRPDCPVSFMTWAVEHGDEQQKLAVAMNAYSPEGLLRTLVAEGEKASHARSLSVPVARGKRLAGEAAKGHVKLTGVAAVADLDRTFFGCVHSNLAELHPRAALRLWNRRLIGPNQWLALTLEVRLAVIGVCTVSDLVDSVASLHAHALAHHADRGVRRLLAKLPDIPPETLDALSHDPDEWVRCAVAGNPSTPASLRIHLMQALAKNDWEEVRKEVAKSPFVSASLLDQLAGDSEEQVLLAVAENSVTSCSTLERLARRKTQGVREVVARHAKAAPALLAKLAKSKNAEIREAVAGNPSTPPAVLVDLARDRSPQVRQSVAGNTSAPDHLLFHLFEADGPDVLGHCLASNSAAPDSLRVASLEAMAAADEYWERCSAAKCVACPPPVLERLAQDAESFVRLCVAGNPASSSALLQRLTRDRSKVVRARAKLGFSGAVPPPLNKELERAVHWHRGLRKAAMRFSWGTTDEALPPKSAEELLAMYRQECVDLLLNPAASVVARMMGAGAANLLLIPAECAASAARCSDRAVRLLGLCNVDADRAVLVKFHRSTDWAVRLVVARNTAAPSGLVDVLSKDAHRLVALQAEAAGRRKTDMASRMLPEAS